ncbi:Ras guanine nucleotide exchange factor A [Madurella fahalii]|uniref:Ras guanine nucleotide exchange factor A n=1 Tax=Madurella fahalii TaxID=1157608 RepID=A0ABQ0G648_9PEZI
MWVQTHQAVSDRPGGAPPQLSVPPATPLRGAAGTAASGADATASAGDPAAVPQPPGQPPSVPGCSEGTFLLVDDPPAASVRDSFASIIDDPFFLRFETPDAPSVLTPTPTPTTATATDAGYRHDEHQPWIPPRKESLSDVNPTPWFEHAKNVMEPINIAVIGAEGVGKSTFIQHLRRATRPTALNITTLRPEVDGTQYLVTLVELDLEGIELDPNQPVQWPRQIGGHMMPRMDGAMILYDGMNEKSTREVPPIMAALANSSLPTLLVATKCDAPQELRQSDLSGLASAFPTCAGHYRTSSNAPGSARECLQAMLRTTLNVRRDKSEGSAPRRRAASTANLDAPLDSINGRPISQHSKHSRASSDFSLLRGYPPPANEGQYRGQPSRSPRTDYQAVSSSSSLNPGISIPEDGPQPTVSSMLRTPGIRLDSGSESFLDVDESDGESFRYSDDVPILQRHDDSFMDRPAKAAGVSFDDLVDRLLAPKMSKADHNFADVFLCLYRKFAAPSELLTAIRARLDQLRTDRTTQMLIRAEAQMRIVEVVAKWVSLYPGDFARPATKTSLEELIKQLATDPAFVAAAQQMRAHLEHKVTEDDDTGWEKSDPPEEVGAMGAAAQRRSGLAESMNSLQMEDGGAPSQRRPSQSSGLSGLETHGGRVPARFQFHTVEDYEREAATLVPTAMLPLNKLRYHMFMEIDADDIADEITRIDWIMFSSIRIRDMVRHVSLSQEQKERCRSLKNVNRMVSHFNHVAQWVANMVLIRDKAKHRAPCLEKFMVIAQKLRQLNNYNGLAAVLAGINGTAIHRLAQTRALVSPEVGKRFAGLVLLMGTQKSHFAYRLAWENSPLPRIPFMPLHRRDLVSAEEGSRTFVGPHGDRINWKKFEVLGEVLLPIMKSQGQPYPNLHRHELSRELILDCRMPTDDEDIYQRSVQVEPTGAPGEPSKKKFPWLAK